MIEIGLVYKNTRDSNGLTIEEVANDNNISVEELKNFEAGDVGQFEDIFRIKELIEILSKYYSIKSEDYILKFNSFLYDFTSRIPLDEVEKHSTKVGTEESEEKMVSPYTHPIKKKNKAFSYVVIALILLITYIVVSLVIKGV